ncbi:MAG TPA: hypothetical protein VEV17_13335 [Bryobacteraceae bacterium]|nr:hypothetical protein [Bryobacteraceae bacterium]
MGNAISTAAGSVLHRERSLPGYQAYQILHVAFTVAPILAGIDKFLHLLVNWDQYLAPWIAALSPVSGHNLMLIAGVVEIAAGVLVAIRPRIFALVVGIWLGLIIVDLVSMGAYLDAAWRDLGLALGAFALWRLAIDFDHDRSAQ